MKAEYRNAIRSKTLIRDALIKLLNNQKDISSITVSDIVKVANINRGTFYNHYNNIMDVLEEIENELFEELLKLLKKHSPLANASDFLYSLIEYFKQQEKNYKPIVKGLSKTVLDNLILKFITQIKEIMPDVDEIMMLFIINGLTGLYFDYLEGKIDMSLDELCTQCISYINNIIISETKEKK